MVRRVPRLVKILCGYCIYVLNLKPLKHNKSVSMPLKIFTTFPAFPTGALEGLLYAARVTLCSVKK